MKKITKLLISVIAVLAALSIVVIFAASVSAAQNSSYPSPSQCNGADWNIGLPDGTTCSSSVTTLGSLDDDPTATSIFGSNSRLKPDLASLNQFCKQYTRDSTSYATYGRMHNYCTACDQNLSWYTGSSWTTVVACAPTLNVQNVHCATGCGPTCTTHSSKQCSGNAVYWYNSCGTKEDLFQQCTASQVCQINQCVFLPIATDLKVNNSDGPITVAYQNRNSLSLSWTSQNATSCTATSTDNVWTGSKSTSGSQTISLSDVKTYTFTLTCVNSAGGSPVSDSVQVVLQAPTAPTVVTKGVVVTY